MPGSATIGRVAVKVVPDTRFFRQDTEAKLETAAKELKAEIPTELDTSELAGELRRTIAILNTYSRLHPVTIRARLEQTDFRRMNEQLQKFSRPRNMKLKTDVDEALTDATRRLRSWRDKNSPQTIDIGTRLDSRYMERLVDGLMHDSRRLSGSWRDTNRELNKTTDLARDLDHSIKSLGNHSHAAGRDLRDVERGVARTDNAMKKLNEHVNDFPKRMRWATRDMLDGVRDGITRDFRWIDTSVDGADRRFGRLSDRIRRMGRDWDNNSNRVISWNRTVSVARDRSGLLRRSLGSLRDTWRSSRSELDKFNHSMRNGNLFSDLRGTTARRLRDDVHRMGNEFDHAVSGMRRVGRWSDTVDRKWSSFARHMERSLGRGSRNNFLHFFGGASAAIISFPIKALTGIGRAVGKVGDIFGTFRDEGFKAGMKSLGGVLASAGSALGTFLAVLIPLAGLVPPLILLVEQFAAALGALLGSITVGVIGALLPLVPILVALGGALGVVVGMFVSLRKKGKWDLSFTKAFDGLTKKLKGLKKTLRDAAVELAPSLDHIAETVLGGIKKLISDYATQIKFVIQDLDFKLNSPKEKKFFKMWGDYLPSIFTALGEALNSFGLGLVNFFAPVLPYAQKLADKISDIADDFLRWTQSKKGQKDIKDFLQRAWEDAKNLGSAIGHAVSGLSALLGLGNTKKTPGDDMLKSLSDTMDKFDKWAHSKSAQDFIKNAVASVKQWIASISDFFSKVQQIVNDPQTKKNLDNLRHGFDNVTGAIQDLMPWIEFGARQFGSFSSVLGRIADAIGDLWTWIDGLDWSEIWDGIKGGAQQLWDWFITPWKKVGDAIVAPFKWAYDTLLGHSVIPDIVNGIIDWLSGLPGDIIVALAGVPAALAQPFIDGFNLIPEPIREGAGIVGSAVSSIWSSSPLVSAFRMGKQLFKGSGSDMAGEMTTSLGDLRKMIGSKVALVPPAVAKGLAPLPRTVKQSFTGISNPALAGIGRLRSDMSGQHGFGGLPGKAASALSPLSGRVSGKFTNASVSSLHAIASMTTQVLDRFGAMARAIPRAMNSMGGELYSAGLNAMYGLRNGISRGGSVAIAAARAVAYAVSAITRAVLDIRSPSRVMASIGVYIPQGLAMGITSGLRYVRNATQTMATSVSSLMTDAFNMTDQGRSAMQSLADGMRSGLRPVASAIATADGLVTGMTPGAAVSQRVASTNLYVPEERYSTQPFPSDMEFQLAITGLETGVMTAVKRNPIVVADATATGNRKARKR